MSDPAPPLDALRSRARRRQTLLRVVRLPALLALAAVVAWLVMIRMPGRSHRGALPPLSTDEQALEAELRRDVEAIAGGIGERNVGRHARLAAASKHLEDTFKDAGYEPRRQEFSVDGRTCVNLEVVRTGDGAPGEIVLVGAHYDSAPGAPGADDNGSGVAAVLALARRFAPKTFARTVKLVLWANEEPPYFQNPGMGSAEHARRSREAGDRIVAMISVETIGYYSEAAGSQKYPAGFGLLYPSTGDFIAFVGNVSSRDLVRRVVGSFRATTPFPSEGVAAPEAVPGIGWSDQWAYWSQGYDGVMVTDTAPFRNPHYHTSGDVPGTLDYARMARVVAGLERVVADLAR
jgi:hypothetical protein